MHYLGIHHMARKNVILYIIFSNARDADYNLSLEVISTSHTSFSKNQAHSTKLETNLALKKKPSHVIVTFAEVL